MAMDDCNNGGDLVSIGIGVCFEAAMSVLLVVIWGLA